MTICIHQFKGKPLVLCDFCIKCLRNTRGKRNREMNEDRRNVKGHTVKKYLNRLLLYVNIKHLTSKLHYGNLICITT